MFLHENIRCHFLLLKDHTRSAAPPVSGRTWEFVPLCTGAAEFLRRYILPGWQWTESCWSTRELYPLGALGNPPVSHGGSSRRFFFSSRNIWVSASCSFRPVLPALQRRDWNVTFTFLKAEITFGFFFFFLPAGQILRPKKMTRRVLAHALHMGTAGLIISTSEEFPHAVECGPRQSKTSKTKIEILLQSGFKRF